MNTYIEELKIKADTAKHQYKLGYISRKEAIELIEPYAIEFNNKSKKIAKKYNMKPKLFSIVGYLR